MEELEYDCKDSPTLLLGSSWEAHWEVVGGLQVGFGGCGEKDGDQYVAQDGGGHGGGGGQEEVQGCPRPAWPPLGPGWGLDGGQMALLEDFCGPHPSSYLLQEFMVVWSFQKMWLCLDEYPNIEYPNIFVSESWLERKSEYICFEEVKRKKFPINIRLISFLNIFVTLWPQK